MTYPMVTYDGHVRYFTEFCDIADACENLTLKVDAIGGNEQVPVAFDMEWPYEPSTDTSGKTSLIQVCMDLDECFLFHLPIVRKLPASLCQFLRHPRVLLHGVNIKGDLHKLEKDFKCGLNMSCVDLRSLYHEVSNSDCFYWSMEVLVKHSLKLSIDKSIRISSWDVVPLTKAQQKYAAIDVFVSNPLNILIFKS